MGKNIKDPFPCFLFVKPYINLQNGFTANFPHVNVVHGFFSIYVNFILHFKTAGSFGKKNCLHFFHFSASPHILFLFLMFLDYFWHWGQAWGGVFYLAFYFNGKAKCLQSKAFKSCY